MFIKFPQFAELVEFPLPLPLKFPTMRNEAFSVKRVPEEEIMQLSPNCYWVISIQVTNLAGQTRTPQEIVLQIIINILLNGSCPGYL